MLNLLHKDKSIIGKPLLVGLPEIKGAPAVDQLFHVYKTGEASDGNEEPVPIMSNGQLETRYFNFSYRPLIDNGRITGVMDIAVEVTAQVLARKKAEASEKHFRSLADIVPAKISNALPNGEVTFFNQHWLDYSGMNFEDLRDFGYRQMMHPDEVATFRTQLAEAAAKGVALESEMRFKDLNGNYRWHLNIASPVINENGEITMWVGSTTDIQRIKDEEQRKNDFIGMVSHELKTPLTSLYSYLQILQAKAAKTDDEFIKKSLDQSVKQVRKMTGMINGFLNVSRLESGQISINKTTFNLRELFAEAAAEADPMHTTHTINFSCEASTPLTADRDKISQVINNLISNAVKYSKPGSIVAVTCSTDERQTTIAVSDQGIGIQTDDLQHVFERYYRVESHTHISGFGIGLYLCAEIIKQHHGKIWAESEPGKGSTFYFSIPRS
jgi:PAS domain S-box-containing protein